MTPYKLGWFALCRLSLVSASSGGGLGRVILEWDELVMILLEEHLLGKNDKEIKKILLFFFTDTGEAFMCREWEPQLLALLPISQAVGRLNQETLETMVEIAFIYLQWHAIATFGRRVVCCLWCTKPNLEYHRCAWGLMSSRTGNAASGPKF